MSRSTTKRKSKRYPKGRPPQKITADQVLKGMNVGADEAGVKGKGLTEGLGMEKEERVLVVPTRVMSLITACLFEAGGSFVLILFTSMAIATIAAPFVPVGSRVASGLAYGCTFAFLHAIMAKYSGGHFNPSTSFGVFLGYQFSRNLKGEYFENGWSKLVWGTVYLVCYTVVQILFSFFAGWALEMALRGDSSGLGVPVITGVTNLGRALFVEIVATCIIMLGYYTLLMEKSKGHLDSILFGIGIIGFYMAAAPVSGGAFNPLRFLGPGIANLPGFSWRQSWVYIVGPYIGVIIGWLIYESVRIFFIPSKQYVGWVPMIFGPKTKTIFAHYVVNDEKKKLFIRM